jgi:hypothetical protein
LPPTTKLAEGLDHVAGRGRARVARSSRISRDEDTFSASRNSVISSSVVGKDAELDRAQ